MSDKTTHFGRAGEYFVMSELLLRGWNVAVPVVDVGDDVFIIDDRDKAIRRVQVKSSTTTRDEDGSHQAQFNLSRAQLRGVQPVELYYVLLARLDERWRFLVIPRADLMAIRDTPPATNRPGRRAKADADAKGDQLSLTVTFAGDTVTGWGAPLGAWLDRWPEDIWIVQGGPGSVEARRTTAPSVESATPAEAPAPSPRPETEHRRRR